MRKPLLQFALFLSLAASLCPLAQPTPADGGIKVMLLTGSSNKYHNWEGSSAAIEHHLNEAKIFSVDKVVAAPRRESFDNFSPTWTNYDVIALDYEGPEWPEATKSSFVEYMKNGGGLVTVHATDNAFPSWREFNEMIGLGGWGRSTLHDPELSPKEKYPSRNETWGPRVHWRGCKAIHDYDSKGGATHPPRHDFLVTVRNLDHPITQGLPEMWLHGQDDLYTNLRGPAKNMTILATAFANPALRNASPYNEPILFTIDYGKGRVFHTTLGNVSAYEDQKAKSLNNVAFITTLQRGTEWAATGKVTLPVPDDFPHAYQTSYRAAASDGWTALLDPDLKQWDAYMGVPHSSVEGLPSGTYQSDNVHDGEAMGLNNDPKNVFATRQENGETILRVTGEIYGGLTTKKEYENYHLRALVRWGEKKWPPRLNRKRDSGILYHCHGEHGAFWQVWKSCLEFQVQENDMGDFITLAGSKAKAPFRKPEGEARSLYDPSKQYEDWSGYLHAAVEPDAPHGYWNTLDLYVVGDQAIHVVNGQIVMSLKDALDKHGEPLTKGQIQIQSEAAEIEYKNLQIRSISAFPSILKQKANL